MIASFPRLLAAAALLLAAGAAQAQTPTLKVQDYPGVVGTLTRVAIEKGYCVRHGVNCTVQTIPNAPLGIQALLSGSIDVALSSVEVAIQSSAKGADLKIAGGGINANALMLFVGPQLLGSPGKGYPAFMHDLKGRKVGVTARGSAAEFQMNSLLINAGMQPHDVTYVAVGAPNTAYPALANKQVDAVMSFAPLDGFCEVLKTCRLALNLGKGEGPAVLNKLNGASALYLVRRDFAQKNPAAVDAFVKALRDAERFATDPANAVELAQITANYYRIEMPNGDQMIKSSLQRLSPSLVVEVKKAAVQAAADYLVQTRQLEKPFDAQRLF